MMRADPEPRGDEQLLRAALKEPDAFGEFYRRHVLRLERWLRSQTSDVATAADLAAETFAQALVNLPRFRGRDDAAAQAWLFGIARNLVRSYYRRGRVELAMCRKLGLQLDHDPDELAELERQLDAAAQASSLAEALDDLPETHRQAVQLRVIDQLDYPEAAALLGTSEQNVRVRVSRGLRALSHRLQGAKP